MAGVNKSIMFAEGIKNMHDGGIQWTGGSDVFRACLMKTSYAATTLTSTKVETDVVFDAATVPDADRADTQYIQVATADCVVATAGNDVNFGGGTVSIVFTTVTNLTSCHGVLIFKSRTTDTISELICYNHFSATVTADGGSVTATLATDGLFKASYVT